MLLLEFFVVLLVATALLIVIRDYVRAKLADRTEVEQWIVKTNVSSDLAAVWITNGNTVHERTTISLTAPNFLEDWASLVAAAESAAARRNDAAMIAKNAR